MKQRITLSYETGQSPLIEAEVIDGGLWAVHPFMSYVRPPSIITIGSGEEEISFAEGYLDEYEFTPKPGFWSVTFVPSGYALCATRSQASALQIAREVRAAFTAYNVSPHDFINGNDGLTPEEHDRLKKLIMSILKTLGGINPSEVDELKA